MSYTKSDEQVVPFKPSGGLKSTNWLQKQLTSTKCERTNQKTIHHFIRNLKPAITAYRSENSLSQQTSTKLSNDYELSWVPIKYTHRYYPTETYIYKQSNHIITTGSQSQM